MFLEPQLHPDRGKGNKGCHKNPEGGLEFPLLGEHGIEKGDAEQAKKNAVNHAYYFHSLRLAPDVFQRHGNTEQDEVGEGFRHADHAEAAYGSAEHERVIGRDDENDKNLVFGFSAGKFKLGPCSAE